MTIPKKTLSVETTIEDLWKRYFNHVYTNVALCPEAYRDLRQTFYSAIYCFFTTLHVVSGKEEQLTAGWLSARREEMEIFFQGVIEAQDLSDKQ